MRIKIHNDGKEKWQSWEVYVNEPLYMVGYGRNENEAFEEFQKEVDQMLAVINDLKRSLPDAEKVYVNGLGEPVVKK